MAPDDLNTPLGFPQTETPSRIRQLVLPLVAGGLGLVIAVFGIWSMLGRDTHGGEPMVVVSTGARADDAVDVAKELRPAQVTEGARPDHAAAPAPSPRATAQEAGAATPEDARQKPTEQDDHVVTIIDGRSGARQEVRLSGAGSPDPAGASTQLIEMTRNGPIPRISADGVRAAQAYAKPVATPPNSPLIAIVVTGLGISASTTTEAINKLPGPITFAFTPYGADLERVAEKARSLGHELLLQVAMEPFDYPDNDPGPQTLLTSLSAEQNVDRLQWAMSRLRGYVGVVNQMGARFTASELSLTPILREIGRRGLIYVDDGSSLRSLASQIAGGASLSFAKASLVLDTVPSAGEIDHALALLEGMARENGIAVGFAAAFPVSIERIVRWVMTAEGRGFTLVPITAAAARSKPN